MLQLIIGKWQTPNHSKKKKDDDTHQVKKDILREVGKAVFSKKVGKNPDLGIDENNNIILKGVGEYKKKPYYVTKIKVEDYFILRFAPLPKKVEISLIRGKVSEKEDEVNYLNIVKNFNNMSVIPKNNECIGAIINSLIEEYSAKEFIESEDHIIIFKSK